MAVQVKMRINRIVDGEQGNRRIREVYLTNTSGTGTALQDDVQTGAMSVNFLGDTGDSLKFGDVVTVTIEPDQKESTPS